MRFLDSTFGDNILKILICCVAILFLIILVTLIEALLFESVRNWIFSSSNPLQMIISFIGVFISMVLAVFAYATAKKSADLLQANLVVKITDSDSSTDFFEAMKKIGEFKKRCDEETKEYRPEFENIKEVDPNEYKKLNKCRRIITQHFLMIYRLKTLNLLDREKIIELVTIDQLKLLINVVQCLHQSIDEKNYDKKLYSFFQEILNDLQNSIRA